MSKQKPLYWVQIAGRYAGRDYQQRETALFGDFVESAKLKQLVRLGYLVRVTDVDSVEHCPCCQAAFMRAGSVKIADRARKETADRMVSGNMCEPIIKVVEVKGLKRLLRALSESQP